MLYAVDEDDLIHAMNAEEKTTYFCSECWGPVRKKQPRKKQTWCPHFYHVKASPSCRLYSKSEDHLVAQLAIQKLLPPGEAVVEKPFLPLLRVADVLWETKRIVFEIQCSQIMAPEVKKRVQDYGKEGYRVVWILDDRMFNRRVLRPAERELREQVCYFVTLRKTEAPLFYDQFEIFQDNRRIYRGQKLFVNLAAPELCFPKTFEEDRFPSQVLVQKPLYFRGDLMQRALHPTLRHLMQNYRALEIKLPKKRQSGEGFWKRFVVNPIDRFLLMLIHRMDR